MEVCTNHETYNISGSQSELGLPISVTKTHHWQYQMQFFVLNNHLCSKLCLKPNVWRNVAHNCKLVRRYNVSHALGTATSKQRYKRASAYIDVVG